MQPKKYCIEEGYAAQKVLQRMFLSFEEGYAAQKV